MSRTGMIRGVVFASMLSLTGIVRAEEDEEIKLADVPAAVKATIESATAGTTIKKIEKSDEDGKTVYEAEFVRDGKKSEITVAPDGKLLSAEEKTTLDALPAAARAAINEKASGSKIMSVEKITEDGKVTFEAKVKKGEKIMEYAVGDDGKIVGEEDVTHEKD